MTKNIFIFIAGLPGIGKTTIAKTIKSFLHPAIHIDIDDFKKQVVDPNLVSKEIDPPEIRWEYYQLAANAAIEATEAGNQYVVMEETFHLSDLREKMTEKVEASGNRVIWVHVTCDLETVKQRASKPREGHILTQEETVAMHVEFSELFEGFPEDQQICSIDNSGALNISIGDILK